MTEQELNALFNDDYTKGLGIHKHFNNPSVNTCFIFCEIAIEQYLFLHNNKSKDPFYLVNWRVNFGKLHSFCLSLVSTIDDEKDESIVELFLNSYSESGRLLFNRFDTNFFTGQTFISNING